MKLRNLIIVVILIDVPGCSSLKSWSYAPEPLQSVHVLSGGALAVLPCQDGRKNANVDKSAFYLIPLVPYGWVEFETPEGLQRHLLSGLWQFRPKDDIAHAIAEELENARIFEEAFYTNRASDGDFILLCTILSTKYEGKIYTYGLSAYGPILWLIGLPAVTISNRLEVELSLTQSLSTPAIWKHNISETTETTNWAYVIKPDFEYDTLLKKGLLKALPSLREAVSNLRKGQDSFSTNSPGR
ncbi:MAG: hypothetical protein ACU843_04705 [Gammaproteobacteria bacterium]